MSYLSSTLSRTEASAVVTAAALTGNVMAATCAGTKCGPKQTAARCGACKAKPAACKASGPKAKGKAKAKCAAKCGAKCAPKSTAKCGACAPKK